MKSNKIKKALTFLVYAFQRNVEAHELSEESQNSYYRGWHDDAAEYSERKQEKYTEKQKYIEKAIQYIRKNKVPIKYGCNDGIIYFSYLGEQISFHSFSQKVREGKIKKYNGKWSNRPNGDNFPKRLLDFIQK